MIFIQEHIFKKFIQLPSEFYYTVPSETTGTARPSRLGFFFFCCKLKTIFEFLRSKDEKRVLNFGFYFHVDVWDDIKQHVFRPIGPICRRAKISERATDGGFLLPGCVLFD